MFRCWLPAPLYRERLLPLYRPVLWPPPPVLPESPADPEVLLDLPALLDLAGLLDPVGLLGLVDLCMDNCYNNDDIFLVYTQVIGYIHRIFLFYVPLHLQHAQSYRLQHYFASHHGFP